MFETRCTMNHALIGWAPTVFYRIDTKHAMMSQNKKTFSVRGARTTDVLIQQNGGWGGGGGSWGDASILETIVQYVEICYLMWYRLVL